MVTVKNGHDSTDLLEVPDVYSRTFSRFPARTLRGPSRVPPGAAQVGAGPQNGRPADGVEGAWSGSPVEAEVSVIGREFEAAVIQVRAAAFNVRARLLEVVRDEFHRALGDVVGRDSRGTDSRGSNGWPSATEIQADREAPSHGPVEPSQDVEPAEQLLDAERQETVSQKPTPSEEPVSGTVTEIGELYEGTVRLSVKAEGSSEHAVRFVDQLGQEPQVRLLRLVGNHKDGVEVWLGLREPLRLRGILQNMEGVARVRGFPPDGSDDEASRLEVRFKESVPAS